ncbi:CheR family methyltransferase [Propionivibrio dicarboxylicus]|uniref:Chemotaxis protein methyltransferase n=1 Tax=Propionivibrio dicarboxylicus TaxID=83767 RepID=A0A1G8J2G7_9RHOO|nr:CheR family methyltransferase [Propionivibrio dicarboxylicus]SDI25439.1 MCP methyltransferase, CheR-type [Propionivibrio dicarboxylicus]
MDVVEDLSPLLPESAFLRTRQLLHAWGGISLSDSKRSMVGNRLKKRLRCLGLSDFDDYLDLVEQDEPERQNFINALTTNLTAFFREEHHFAVLADYLREQPGGKTINIWCAAASTGEEPYSIAMTAVEALGERAARRIRIVASDLDTGVLAHAETGVYGIDRIERLSRDRLRRFFFRGTGKYEGKVKVKPELRAMISFRQINLLGAQWPVPQHVDVLFCRNVMIYFNKETQAKILERFVPLLAPTSLLIAGHSESYSHVSHLFRPVGRTIYRLVNPRGRQ